MTKYNDLTQSIITHTLQAFQADYFSKIEIKAVDYMSSVVKDANGMADVEEKYIFKCVNYRQKYFYY